jgi:hypothetical protein
MAKSKRVAKTEMNDKEKKTLAAFPVDEPIALAELAKKAFPSMGAKSTTRGNSWVRNSLRFLIRTKKVKQVARGLYQKCQTATAKKATKPHRSTTKKTVAPKTTRTSNGTHAATLISSTIDGVTISAVQ